MVCCLDVETAIRHVLETMHAGWCFVLLHCSHLKLCCRKLTCVDGVQYQCFAMSPEGAGQHIKHYVTSVPAFTCQLTAGFL